MNPSERKYTGPLQYFHNYEHDPEGRTHCKGPASNPYAIEHRDGVHVINCQFARGHGKGNKPQWFKFMKRVPGGWDLASGEMVEVSKVPERGKKPGSKFDNYSKLKNGRPGE